MSYTLTDKFIEGLKNYNLTYDDIIKYGWMYAGGDYNEHLRYFWLISEGTNLTQPYKKDFCVCGVSIKRNAYIMNGDKTRIIVIGSCCIKRFIPIKTRTCELCGKPHKNRNTNKCNDCKIVPKKGKICVLCAKPHRNRIVNKCDDCRGMCIKCKTDITSRYNYAKYEKCRKCESIKECILCKKEHTNRVDKCDHCCNKFKNGVCADCGKKCNEKYKRCYYCNKKQKELLLSCD